MDVMDLCRKTYQDFITRSDYPSDLKRALRVHERVPAFIDNLAREFHKCQARVKREEIILAVEDLSRIFCGLVQRQALERIMSPLSLASMRKQEEAKEEFRREAEALDQKGADNVFETKKGEIVESKIIIDAL
jgi:acyl carrier protein phosphodiesterase